jgi:mgtE-like transporter
VRESFPILCVAIVLDVLAGAVVQPRTETVFERFPALLIVLPGFLEITGALGGILAARLGSKLHLGVVSPRVRPDAVALLDGSIIFVLGATVYTLISTATLGLAELFNRDYPGAFRFLGLVISGGLLSTLVATVIGYYAATATYRFGLDPDNQTIPVVTSGMDLLGVICLVLALVVFGVA